MGGERDVQEMSAEDLSKMIVPIKHKHWRDFEVIRLTSYRIMHNATLVAELQVVVRRQRVAKNNEKCRKDKSQMIASGTKRDEIPVDR